MWNSVHPSKGKVGKSSSPQKCRLRNAQGVVRHSSALCGPSYCLFFVAHVSFLGMALNCFHGNIFWWKGVWQISGFICSFADSPWSSYMRPHANFGFLSKLFSWVYQPTEKPICIPLSNGCSKQRCPRVMMITWRHCDGPIVPLKFHRKCFAILMLFQKSQSIQSSSWQCLWGNLLQEAAAWVWAT